jgi:hypothetical protein
MQANQLCPSPHLEAADLCGKDKVVTIKEVCFKLVGEAKVNKGVVMFQEFDRGMVLNRTNLKRVIAQHGMETDDWVGKKVTLYPSETDFQGKTVPCLRVREKK